MKKPDMKEARKRQNKQINYTKYEGITEKFGKNKKYFVRTYGCQMNEHDSEKICGMLESVGFTKASEIEESDVVILNTCAIRENAHDKVFGFLGVLKHIKDTTNPNLLIGICGCMAQEEVVVNELLKKYKYVDFVCGTHNLDNLLTLIEQKIETNNRQIEVLSYEGDVVEDIPVIRESKYSAWVDIIYGCDKFCTYCIVPYTRGKQRSRKKEDIINEVKSLKEKGYKEITLLGQNVNAYGKDMDCEVSFAELLEMVAKSGIERLRFVTSHPWDFTDEMIDVIAKYDNIMPYIHLPLQAGSSRILKLMGRKYTKEEYLELFNKIKERIPGCAITTDIIVGFPNESDEDFKETLDVVNTCKYDSAFTFIYSPRVGTPAAKMKDSISKEVKEARLQELNKLVNKYSNEKNQTYLNKVVKVLVTEKSQKGEGKVCGYTEDMKLVNVEAPIDTIGKIVDVLITDAKSFSLDGKLV